MRGVLLCFASATTLLATASGSPVFAQADLVVEKSDISLVKWNPNNTTYVTATVHNAGSVGSGAFTLRVGVSIGGSSSTADFVIADIPAGQSSSETASFVGTNWKCGWGNADIVGEVPETNDGNNAASDNHYWISLGLENVHDEIIGVVNPGLDAEILNLIVNAPADWYVTVDSPQMTLEPGEHQDVLVHFEAPEGFKDYACVELYGHFEDGTPGVMDWEFHIESAVPVKTTTWGAIKSLFASR